MIGTTNIVVRQARRLRRGTICVLVVVTVVVPAYAVYQALSGSIVMAGLLVAIVAGAASYAVLSCVRGNPSPHAPGPTLGEDGRVPVNIKSLTEVRLEDLSRVWMQPDADRKAPTGLKGSIVVLDEDGPPDPGEGEGRAPEAAPPSDRDEGEAPDSAPDNEKHSLTHPGILSFYREVIPAPENGFGADPALLNIAEQILILLEKYGACPSVVETHVAPGRHEFNNELKVVKISDKVNLWSILRRVNLIEHSLEVARLCAKRKAGGVDAPVAIVAALAHDVGKIPHYYTNSLYAGANHPATSVNVLNMAVKGFSALPPSIAETISVAVLKHHGKLKEEREGSVGETLRAADHEARRNDLARYMASAGDGRTDGSAAADYYTDPGRGPVREADTAAGSKRDSRVLEFSAEWLDVQKLIDRIKPVINRAPSGKFVAVSMHVGTAKGTVYVQTGYVADTANNLAAEALLEIRARRTECVSPEEEAEQARRLKALSAYMAGDVSADLRRAKILSVVKALREQGCLTEEMLDGYIGSTFECVYEDGHKTRLFAVPFNSGVFGMTREEMESRKEDAIVRKIVKISTANKTKEQE